MTRLLTLTGAVAMTALTLASVTWADDVQGKVKSVDPSGTKVTLEDGTQLTIPGNLDLRGKALKPGADVRVIYADRGSDKVVTSIEVRPGPTK